MKRTRRAVVAAAVVASAVPAASSARPACPVRTERVEAGTWRAQAVDHLEGRPFTWQMAADERDPRLVVVTDTEGILVTRDGGCRWERAALYDDVTTTPGAVAQDLEVAGTGRSRSLHVLVQPPFGEPRVLLSSFDDGRTWSAEEVPLQAASPVAGTATLSSSPAGGGTLYLLLDADFGSSTLFAGTGDADEWRWTAAALPAAPAGECTAGPCTAPPLRKIQADPDGPGAVWALGATEASGTETRLRLSPDDGSSWEEVAVPDLLRQAVLFDVAPRPGTNDVLLLGGFSEFAYSADAGISWQVGSLPELTSSDWTSTDVFDVAHFDRGRSFATIYGNGPTSEWAGNVFVLGGGRWADASPRDFAGYDSPETFAALTSTAGPLLALASTGELMAFSD